VSAEPSPAVRRRSPLHAEHAALGARFTEFGGWEMPLSYPAGTVAEHLSCRNHAAVFDVSHLGTVRVSGRDAFTVLQSVLTNDLARIAPGRAQYSHLLDPADASVVDDVIVWWVSEQRFDVMPNASNTDRLVDAVTSEVAAMRSSAIEIEEVTEQRAVVALQGPAASEILAALGASVERFAVSGATLAGVGCVIAGTGYTGERGAEIACRVDDAPGLWRALVAEGAAPAGLGARDTLRLEAGLPLHGHELGPGITPDDARLSWVVRTAKGPFRGCEALARARSSPGRRRLHGLLGDDRRPLRDGAIVLDANGSPIGTTSSGSFSPVLERGIALAFLDRDLGDGTRVGIELRGRIAPAVVTTPPFVRSPR
jgi:aminomethyltransferase